MRNILGCSVLTIGALLFSPLDLHAEETTEALAKQAQEEFDAVAPEVKAMAAKFFAHLEEQNKKRGDSSTTLALRIGKTFSKILVNSEGEHTRFATENKFQLQARNERFEYEFVDVNRVQRTGDRDYPLEAVVTIHVKTTFRHVSEETKAAITLPDGYRLTTDEELADKDGPIVVLAIESQPEDVLFTFGFPSGSMFGIPVVVSDQVDLSRYPESVQTLAETLREKSLAAEPSESIDDFKVTFRYSLEKQKWRWWDTKQAPAGRDLKEESEATYF